MDLYSITYLGYRLLTIAVVTFSIVAAVRKTKTPDGKPYFSSRVNIAAWLLLGFLLFGSLATALYEKFYYAHKNSIALLATTSPQDFIGNTKSTSTIEVTTTITPQR